MASCCCVSKNVHIEKKHKERTFQLLLHAQLAGSTALLLAAAFVWCVRRKAQQLVVDCRNKLVATNSPVGGTRRKARVALAADLLVALVLLGKNHKARLNDTAT